MSTKKTDLQRQAQSRATCLYRVGSTISHIKFLRARVMLVRDEQVRAQLLTITDGMQNHASTMRAMILGLAPDDFMAP